MASTEEQKEVQTSSQQQEQPKEEEEEKEKGETKWWESVELPVSTQLAQQVHDDFLVLKETVGPKDNPVTLIYLDSAATSHTPNQVMEVSRKYYETMNSNVHRGAHELSRRATEAYEASRDKVAHFIGAYSRNEIIFTSGATEALNLVAHSFAFGTHSNDHEDDDDAPTQIIITEMEHHSNIVPWQIAVETSKKNHKNPLTLDYIPVDHSTGSLDWDVFEQLLSPKTKVVSLQHVSNVMGCVHPIKDKVVPMVRRLAPNAVIVLDACQSVPHMPVSVKDLGVDFLAASGHKMCGPTGSGFLWGREELLAAMPPYMGGGEMIQDVFMDHSTYAPPPARFEAGTPPIEQAIALGGAIDYLEQIGGMDKIHEAEVELSNYLYKRLSEVPSVHVLGPKLPAARAALCAFHCDHVHSSDLSTFLDLEGVAIRAGHHCCQPLHRSLGYSHSSRASLYFYNTKEDIDNFIERLETTLHFFDHMGKVGLQKETGDDFVPFV